MNSDSKNQGNMYRVSDITGSSYDEPSDQPITPFNEFDKVDIRSGNYKLTKGGNVVANIVSEYGFIKPLLDSYNDFYDRGLEKIFASMPITFRAAFMVVYSDQYCREAAAMGRNLGFSHTSGNVTMQPYIDNVKVQFSNLRIHRPVLHTFKTEAVGDPRVGQVVSVPYTVPLLPQVARDRSLTYTGKVTGNITISDSNGNILQYKENADLYETPVMVGSKACNTYSLEESARTDVGECFTDPGGYFIRNGSEVLVLVQKKLRTNTHNLFMQKIEDETGSVKKPREYPGVSVTCTGPRRTSNVTILLIKKKLAEEKSAKEISAMYMHTSTYMKNIMSPFNLFLAIYEFYHTMMVKYTPVIGHEASRVLFWKDLKTIKQEVLSLIPGNHKSKRKISNFLQVSVAAAQSGFLASEESRRISFLTTVMRDKDKYPEPEYRNLVQEVIDNEIYPDIIIDYSTPEEAKKGLDLKLRQIYLMVIKLAEYGIGDRDFDDRDFIGSQRFEFAGTSLHDLTRSAYGLFVKEKLRTVNGGVGNFDHDRSIIPTVTITYTSHNSNPTITTTGFDISKFVPSSMTSDIVDSFAPNRWGVNAAKKNIVDTLRTDSILYRLSYLLRISTPSKTSGTQLAVRMAKMGQITYVCFGDTPEGQNTGLVTYPCICFQISKNRDEIVLLDLITSKKITLTTGSDLFEQTVAWARSYACSTNCIIYLNGKRVGYSTYLSALGLRDTSNVVESKLSTLTVNIKAEKFEEQECKRLILQTVRYVESPTANDVQLSINNVPFIYVTPESGYIIQERFTTEISCNINNLSDPSLEEKLKTCRFEITDGNKKSETFLMPTSSMYDIFSVYPNSYSIENMISDIPTEEFPHRFIINGKFKGFCDSSKMSKLVREIRRSNIEFYDISCVVDEINKSFTVFADASRILSPRLIVNEEGNNLVISDKNMWESNINELLTSGCIEFVDPQENETLDICYSIEYFYEIQKNIADLENRIKIINDILPTIKDNKATHDKLKADLENSYEKLNKLKEKYTHCEIHPSLQGGLAFNIIPLANHNQAPRNTFQCQMGKQSMMIPNSMQRIRFDTTMKQLVAPTPALFEPQINRMMRMTDELPSGEQITVAIMDRDGWTSEDAFVLNQSAIDRGLFRYTVVKTYTAVCSNVLGSYTEEFAMPPKKESEDASRYNLIDSDGIPYVNAFISEGQCVIGKIRKYNEGGVERIENASILIPVGESGFIQRVVSTTNAKKEPMMLVSVRQPRVPKIGDKAAPRHAQKGTFSLTERQEDLPFDELTGEVAMLYLTSHQIPSRMTMGMLIEILASKATLLSGEYFDATSFSNVNIKKLFAILRAYGFHYGGKHRMIDGRTGKYITCMIARGPLFEQLLRHNVDDKKQARARGPINKVTRQPNGGRTVEGGIRFGEMERDALIGHGVEQTINERLLKVSDASTYPFCIHCGIIPDVNPALGYWKCQNCGGERIGRCTIPHPFKNLMNYFAGMGVKMNFSFEQ